MTTKIKMRKYVVFIKLRNFDTADIKDKILYYTEHTPSNYCFMTLLCN